jgi:hypothetical protein
MCPRFAFAVVLLCGSAGCSSSSASSPATGPGEDARPTSSPDAGASPGDDATVAQPAGDDASSGQQEASAPIVDARAEAAPSHPAVDASSACVSFCECMAMNCAQEVFPDGCLYDCATQTNWDLECRAGMCSLVQSEPNNDHCTHAFGVDECLDKVTADH